MNIDSNSSMANIKQLLVMISSFFLTHLIMIMRMIKIDNSNDYMMLFE